mmetsp:Transcript_27938/g.23428  ORF Transcript_27938/g.23428 Transcript_27938/m.23428 type:complete len:90 (-) Transcript_27938:154-423(-)
MDCPAGQQATKPGAATASDGCAVCAQGSWHPGSGDTSCAATDCPAGSFAGLVTAGATSASDGCAVCPRGSWSPGSSETSCAAMDCPAGQ